MSQASQLISTLKVESALSYLISHFKSIEEHRVTIAHLIAPSLLLLLELGINLLRNQVASILRDGNALIE